MGEVRGLLTVLQEDRGLFQRAAEKPCHVPPPRPPPSSTPALSVPRSCSPGAPRRVSTGPSAFLNEAQRSLVCPMPYQAPFGMCHASSLHTGL